MLILFPIMDILKIIPLFLWEMTETTTTTTTTTVQPSTNMQISIWQKLCLRNTISIKSYYSNRNEWLTNKRIIWVVIINRISRIDSNILLIIISIFVPHAISCYSSQLNYNLMISISLNNTFKKSITEQLWDNQSALWSSLSIQVYSISLLSDILFPLFSVPLLLFFINVKEAIHIIIDTHNTISFCGSLQNDYNLC